MVTIKPSLHLEENPSVNVRSNGWYRHGACGGYLISKALNNAEIWFDFANEHESFDELKPACWTAGASARFFMIKALMLRARLLVTLEVTGEYAKSQK